MMMIMVGITISMVLMCSVPVVMMSMRVADALHWHGHVMRLAARRLHHGGHPLGG